MGTLGEGKLADVIVVDGDPREDLEAFDDMMVVIVDRETVSAPD